MTRIVRPQGGNPWEKPGFKFAIDWPVGYKSVAAAQVIAAKRGKAAILSVAATMVREENSKTGKGGGNGTIAGMGKA